MTDRTAKVAPQRVDGTLEEGRLTVSLADPTATLAVDAVERPPLGEHEPAATLTVGGDDLFLAINLTADEIEALVAGLAAAPGVTAANGGDKRA